ncbi:hypothetical protein GCK32_008180, partial [Trichostrongylus colubriformis]
MSHQTRSSSKLLVIAECFALVAALFAVAFLVYSIDWMRRSSFCGRTGELISYMTAIAAAFNLAFMVSTMIGILFYRCDNNEDNLRGILLAGCTIALLTSICFTASTFYILIFLDCREGVRMK